MPSYQFTGHIELAGNKTASIRTTIEANTREEAEERFKAFLQRKATPVVTSCNRVEVDPAFQQVESIFKNMFSGLSKKP